MSARVNAPSTLTRATFDDARKTLEALPELPPAQKPITLREGIKAIRDSIEAAKARGYTLEVIAERLGAAGIDISPSTLQSYMRPQRRRSRLRKAAGTGSSASSAV
jgi:hypothetical protein